MFEWITKYWLEFAFGVLAAGVGVLFRHLFNRVSQANARQEAMERGIQALLRDNIVKSYYYYLERGNITLHGLESAERMYTEYHNLGGNGTITKLIEDMREFTIEDVMSKKAP